MSNENILLSFPYPPSVNTYWGFRGSRRFLTKKATEFKKEVAQAFNGKQGLGDHKAAIVIYLYPPDKRIRDIDNVCKPLLDALVQAGVMDDDSQIDQLSIIRCQQFPKGKCLVKIFDLQKCLPEAIEVLY